jgi:hypothetical protein
MKFFAQYCTYAFIKATRNLIILVSIYATVLFASQAKATRFNNYTQVPLSVNKKSDWNVQYEATIGASITVPEADQEMSMKLSEYKTKGPAAETKTNQYNDTHIQWDIVTDKTREHRNVRGMQTSDTDRSLSGNVQGSSTDIEPKRVGERYNGHVGLRTEVSDDKTERRKHKKQDAVRSRDTEELDASPVFIGLLNEEGNYICTYIRFLQYDVSE